MTITLSLSFVLSLLFIANIIFAHLFNKWIRNTYSMSMEKNLLISSHIIFILISLRIIINLTY